MKTAKENNVGERVDVDALLAAINEISATEAHRIREVSSDDGDYHAWRELAEAFELDIHDVSITEINR
ncbi:DUF2525 domain-containing protein [Klebsiella indica]|uniref:DUF2525 domain-containing protein n=1 Tax=Klebsiella indica TaxID=2582917 RepID=A0A5R9L9L7_9ENTR|nr:MULTISPECIES: YodD family peroxide/acid resistance protein [Klebsiella]TLV05563.1 DUF2525 domain-containing protein [Klebsiella indica]